MAAKSQSLQMILHLYAKRSEPIISRDASYFEKLAKRLDKLMQERPKLKKVFEYSLKFNTIVLNIAKAFASLDKVFKVPTKVDKQLADIITTSKQILMLDNNLKHIIQSLKSHTKYYALPEVMAYEDVLAHSLLTESELDKVIQHFKDELKNLKESYKKLRPALQDLKQRLEKRLQEGFDVIKRIIGLALNILYRAYKKISLFVVKVQNIIASRYNSLAEKVINSIAGDDPKLQILLSGLMPLVTGLAMKKLFTVSFFGPIAGILTIASVIQQIASLEITAANLAQSIVGIINQLDNLFEDLELE